MFIAVDGIDGAGKTTLVRQFLSALRDLHPLGTKEPTDQSHWGQKLRAAAVNGRLPRDQEIDFFHQDRIHHVERIIKPAIAAGRIVITDRYINSLLAFQTDSSEEANALYNKLAPDILIPDVTFILNCPVAVGLRRIKKNRPTTTQYEKTSVLERARRIYASREGEHYAHLNASRDPAYTLSQAVEVLETRFPVFRGYPYTADEVPSEARRKAL